ncbi:MAG: AI-2E family transporter [Oscillospiraceae bacterium]|nr:AI-2E family transporter [Oscillospiraceae bacterium]
MNKIRQLLEKRWAAYTFALCSAVILYLFLTHITPLLTWISSLLKLLSPVVIGLVLAYLLDPAVKFLEEKLFRRVKKEATRRALSVVLAVLCLLLLLTLLFSMLIPNLIGSITSLVGNANTYLAKAEELLAKLSASDLGSMLALENIADKLEEFLTQIFSLVTDNLRSIITSVGAVGGALLNWVIGFILSLYFLLGKKGLVNGLDQLRRAALSPENYERRTRFWKRCNQIFVQFIGCNLLDALIVGVSNALFMSIMQMPYTPLVSVLVAVFNLLPTFGPMIGAAAGAVILLFHQPFQALWFLLFTVVLQTLDGYVLKPRLFSSSFGIPAVWTLLAIIVFGKLFGIVGVLLSIPVAAVIAMLYKESFLPWLSRRRGQKQ